MGNKRIIILTAAAVLALSYAFCLPRHMFESPVSAVLTDDAGRLLGARTAADGQWRFPPSDKVPAKFAECIITYEDKRFRHHPGVDPLAVARAVRLNLGSGERRSGASTITMQTIRLSRPWARRSYAEKILEAILATRLELRCSKDEILRLYADNAPFGGNVVGIQAASWRYWGRSAEELTWAESATLAVLPNSPALIHPGRAREKLLEKRDFLLGKLMEAGKIDSLEYSLALEEPLPDKPLPLPDHAGHYLETLRGSQGDRLFETAIHSAWQIQAERILQRYRDQYSANQVNNIAAIIIRVTDGAPVVYCGNASDGSRQNGSDVDVITARRSSGSTLKPLLYAGMLDDGLILPTMLVADIPFHYKDFSPSNSSHSFDGAVKAEDVIRRSLNVPSVRMLQEYGTGRFIDLLGRCGFTTIDRGEDVYGLSLILGGAEVTLGELAGAYRNMALALGGGENVTPLSKGAIWCTMEALKGLTRPEEEISWQLFSSSREVAWKTGTSYGNRDAWSIGVTPEYVIGVWVGNCNGEGRPQLTGVGYAAPVMFDLLGMLPSGKWFDKPAGLAEIEVCTDSGYPVSDICPEDHRTTVTAPAAVQVPAACPYHHILHLSPDGAWQVDSGCCDPSLIRNEAWFVLPPAQQWYYSRTHSDYREPPPFHPLFSGNAGSSVLQIIYPQPEMVVAAPVAIDGVSRGIVFSAAHNDPSATIYWHLDSEYLGETTQPHKLSAVPGPGMHRLLVTDTNGNTASVRFECR